MRLSDADKSAIEARVAAFEQGSGAQAVVSIVDRCDSYPEVPWRAYALGTAVAALSVWAVPFADALLYHSTTLMLAVILGAGILSALLAVFLPVTGRWLLPRERRENEVRQYAQAMFLTRELHATRNHSAVLILLGRYERCAVILADSGVGARLPVGRLSTLEEGLNVALKVSAPVNAILDTLKALEAALQGAAVASSANEIPDRVIREPGN